MKTYATERITECGCCRRPVRLLETARTTTLVELVDGRRLPHTCPDEAVRRWDRLEAMARLARRGRAGWPG